MRTVDLTLATLASFSLALAQEPPKTKEPPPLAEKVLALGDELPRGMTFRGIDGKQYALDQWRGQVVVVHFWSTTCSYEAVAEPKLNALAAEFAAKGAVVLGIAANANELGAVPDAKDFDGKDAEKLPYAKLRAKAKDSKLVHPILVDHEGVLGRLLDAKTTPHCFVFDKDGKLQYQGALDDDPAGKNDKTVRYVRDAVAALLAGAKPEVQSTKAYGSRTKFAPRTVPKKG